MPGRVVLEVATRKHVLALRGRLREADRREVQAALPIAPDDALEASWESSELAWAGVQDGLVLGVGGVSRESILSSAGILWLLCAPEVERCTLSFVRLTSKAILSCLERFEPLYNHVDARNALSLAWLAWLGARIGEPKPHGWLGMPFRRFDLRGDDYVRS